MAKKVDSNQVFIEERTRTFKRLLDDYIDKTGKSQLAIAQLLGYDRGQVISDIKALRYNISPEAFDKFMSLYNDMGKSVLEPPKAVGANEIKKVEGERYFNATGPLEPDSQVEEPETTYHERRFHKKLNQDRRRIPFYDADAVGGTDSPDMAPVTQAAGSIDVGDLLDDSEAAIRVYGNSMIPSYPPGCVVGLIRVKTNIIEPGLVYVIETPDRRLLKRVFWKNEDQDTGILMLVSDNDIVFTSGARKGKPAFPAFYLPLADVVAMYEVTGSIKRNRNSAIIHRNGNQIVE